MKLLKLNELNSSAEKGLAFLEKQKEVKEAEIFVSHNRLNVFRLWLASNIPSNSLEEAKSNDSFGLSIRVLFSDGKIGFGKTDSDLSLESVKKAFEKAKYSKIFDPDFKSFPSPKGKPKKINSVDKKIMSFDAEKGVDLAYECINSALAEMNSGKKIKEKNSLEKFNLTGELDFLSERICVMNSNGVNASDESSIALGSLTTIFELSPAVSGMWFDCAASMNKFDAEKIGKVSVQKAKSLFNGKHLDSGSYDVVFGRLAFADLLYSRLDLNLGAVDLKATPFAEKLDSIIASEKISIYDDALIEGAIGSKSVSCEGIPTGKTSLIEKGMLVNFLSNDYYTKKFSSDKRFNACNGFRFGGIGRDYSSEPGIYSSNLVVKKGDFSESELIKEIKNGIYIGRIWYTYGVNGANSSDFTSTIRGDSYIIENSEIKSPLVPNTLRINDNLERILMNITGLSKKQLPALAWGEDAAVLTPEVAVKGVKVERIAKGLY